MLYNSIKTYKCISIGDEVRIKGKYIPPTLHGVHSVHSAFVHYMKEEDNLFTISDIKYINVNEFIITVFEVFGLLDYKHIMPILLHRRTRIFNWSDRWQQKVLNLKTIVK